MSILRNIDNAIDQVDAELYNDALSSLCEAKEKAEAAIKTLQVIADNPEWLDHHCRAITCLEQINN